MYLRGLAGKTADDVLNRLSQVAALLPHTYQEVMQLLTPAKYTQYLNTAIFIYGYNAKLVLVNVTIVF